MKLSGCLRARSDVRRIAIQTACILFLCVSGSLQAQARTKILAPNEYGESGKAKGTYFHLYAEYLVGGSERLVFDLQVSCGTHSFEDGRVGRGYLPALYAKKTADGAAVMIATPRVCDAIRFAEKREVRDTKDFRAAWQLVLEGNFVPFTVWFEDAENLTYGTGFAVVESFENPSSPLKFVDARIEPSTGKAFSRWFKSDSGNLLKEVQIGPQYATKKSDQTYWRQFDPGKKLLPLKCYGVAIAPNEEYSNQHWVEQFYPKGKPRYWLAPEGLPDTRAQGKPSKEHLVPFASNRGYFSGPSVEFPIGFNYLRKRQSKKRVDTEVFGPSTCRTTIP